MTKQYRIARANYAYLLEIHVMQPCAGEVRRLCRSAASAAVAVRPGAPEGAGNRRELVTSGHSNRVTIDRFR